MFHVNYAVSEFMSSVIDMVRQYIMILRSILLINLIMCKSESDISSVDKIVIIRSLCNHCDSVVPLG